MTLKTFTVRSAAHCAGRELFTTPDMSVPSAVIVTVTLALRYGGLRGDRADQRGDPTGGERDGNDR